MAALPIEEAQPPIEDAPVGIDAAPPAISEDVRGFSDDPPMEDAAAYNAEMERRMTVKQVMRTVLRPLVERLPSSQMDQLQVIVKAFMLKKPDLSTFPYSECGHTLVEFVRAVCVEHQYSDIERILGGIVEERALREAQSPGETGALPNQLADLAARPEPRRFRRLLPTAREDQASGRNEGAPVRAGEGAPVRAGAGGDTMAAHATGAGAGPGGVALAAEFYKVAKPWDVAHVIGQLDTMSEGAAAQFAETPLVTLIKILRGGSPLVPTGDSADPTMKAFYSYLNAKLRLRMILKEFPQRPEFQEPETQRVYKEVYQDVKQLIVEVGENKKHIETACRAAGGAGGGDAAEAGQEAGAAEPRHGAAQALANLKEDSATRPRKIRAADMAGASAPEDMIDLTETEEAEDVRMLESAGWKSEMDVANAGEGQSDRPSAEPAGAAGAQAGGGAQGGEAQGARKRLGEDSVRPGEGAVDELGGGAVVEQLGAAVENLSLKALGGARSLDERESEHVAREQKSREAEMGRRLAKMNLASLPAGKALEAVKQLVKDARSKESDDNDLLEENRGYTDRVIDMMLYAHCMLQALPAHPKYKEALTHPLWKEVAMSNVACDALGDIVASKMAMDDEHHRAVFRRTRLDPAHRFGANISAADRDRVNRLEEKAHHHWRNGEFKDSKTVFEKALKIAPRMFGMDGTIARVSACQAKASELSDHNGDELIAAEEAEKASSAKKKKKKNKKKGGGAVSRKGGLDLDDDEDSHPAAGGRGDGGGGGSEDEDGAALEDWGAGGKDRAAGREAPGRRGVGGEAWVLDIQRRAPEEEAKEQGVWEVAENSKERKGRKGKGVKPGATIDWANGMGAAALYEHPPGGVGGGVGGDRGAEAGSVEWAGAAARVAHKASPIAAKGRADGAAWRLEEEEGRAGPPVFLHSAAAAGGGASGGEHLPRGDGAVSAGPSGGPSDQKGADPDLENDECVICFEGAKTHIVIPCGHLALCGTCAAFIGTSLAACPVCNIAACAPFSVKMFRT